MKQNNTLQFIVLFMVVILTFSCSLFDKRASVSVAFSRSDVEASGNSRALSSVTPYVLKRKFVAIYLAEDFNEETGNIGEVPMIYLHPQCDGECADCDISDAENIVTEYFDFSRPIDEVNTQINAQNYEIPIGTYRYVGIEFMRNGTADNLIWGTTDFQHETHLGQGIVRIKMEEPLVVKKGDSVTVNLAYSLVDIITVDDNSFVTENSDFTYIYDGDVYTLEIPDFIPTAQKN